MRLSEHRLGRQWLGQFDARDIHVARLVLDSLKLVSLADFEKSISNIIETICAKTTGHIGVFSLDERIIDPNNKPGSAGRLAHALTNLNRLHPDRILVQPSETELRAKKVKNIVLFEDFVGSGNRVIEFWDKWASKTLKSWLSYHVCDLWLAGYAIHDGGFEAICERITYLQTERIHFEIRLLDTVNYWPDSILSFFDRHAERTELPIYPRGFGHMATPIVFQHGCPDNCPVVLWKNGKTFHALFPGRGIPVELNSCFEEYSDSGRGPGLLWNIGQHRLALSLIAEMRKKGRSEEYLLLLAVLGLLLRGVKVNNLTTVMTVEFSRIEDLLAKSRELGLVDGEGAVTLFGRDIVERSRGSFLALPKLPVTATGRGVNYVPRQFK